jgi:hypothetical protein
MVYTGVLKYCLRGTLGTKQQNTLFFFLDTVTSLLAEYQDPAALESLKSQVSTALAMLERDFPVSVQVLLFA